MFLLEYFERFLSEIDGMYCKESNKLKFSLLPFQSKWFSLRQIEVSSIELLFWSLEIEPLRFLLSSSSGEREREREGETEGEGSFRERKVVSRERPFRFRRGREREVDTFR